MHNSATYPILGHILAYTDDYQLHHEYHPMTLGIQVRLLISWHEYAQECYERHAYVTQWATSWLKCTQTTLAIGGVKNTFPLHTKTQNYHLKHSNVLFINVIIRICVHFKKCTYVDEWNHIGN